MTSFRLIFKERAFKEFDFENRYMSEARIVWKGNEDLFELKNKVEQEVEQSAEGDGFENVEQLFSIMKERLNDEEFEVFKKLRNKEVICYNELETKFYAGNGCIDYVWVERNGRKRVSFTY